MEQTGTAAAVRPKRRITRRGLLRAAGVGFAGAAGFAGYVTLVEPRRLELRETIVPLAGLPRGREVRVLQLSDLHYSWCVPASFIRRAVELGLNAKPDVICLTGDYVTNRDERDLGGLADALAPLARRAPTFAVLGNHDGGPWSDGCGGRADSTQVVDCLKRAGALPLENQLVRLEVAGARLAIAGLGDLWNGPFDPKATFAEAGERDGVTMALAHNPDSKRRLADHPWDLMLSGHTHGGQVVLPWVGPPFLPVEDRAFVKGLYAWNGRSIYISRGVGNLLGVRLACRPEVTLLRLVGA